MDYNNTEKYNTDVKGDLYEYLLSKLSTSGTNGQFRTARHIIKMMATILDPKPGEYLSKNQLYTLDTIVSQE